MQKKSDHVPESMLGKFAGIVSRTDAFGEQYLDEEYRQLIRLAVGTLCRKRPSPLLNGGEESWAAGIVHAIGAVNFLFDKSQTPHCTAPDIYAFFGVAPSTGQAKSKKVQELLKIQPFSFQWSLPSRAENNPLIWMLEVNGVIVDIRQMPREAQEIAYERGLIPFVPGRKGA